MLLDERRVVTQRTIGMFQIRSEKDTSMQRLAFIDLYECNAYRSMLCTDASVTDPLEALATF